MLNGRARGRGGYSVMEMLVSLVVGAIAIGLVGAFGFRQQRFHRDIVVAAERVEQLEQAASLLPIALRSIAPSEGDIPPGAARDTSLEFRATITSAVVCDSGHGGIVLAPANTDPPRLASILTRPTPGDTVWSLTLGPAGENWVARPVSSVGDSTTTCLLGGVSPWVGGPRSSLVLRVAAPLPAGPGTVVRVTRTWRYSIYRASDGDWYLGAKDWNPATLRFNTIQPVSGPYLSAAAGGLRFRYSDSAGGAIASGAADTRGIALVEATVRVSSALPGQFVHAIGVRPEATAAVALRNRAK